MSSVCTPSATNRQTDGRTDGRTDWVLIASGGGATRRADTSSAVVGRRCLAGRDRSASPRLASHCMRRSGPSLTHTHTRALVVVVVQRLVFSATSLSTGAPATRQRPPSSARSHSLITPTTGLHLPLNRRLKPRLLKKAQLDGFWGFKSLE